MARNTFVCTVHIGSEPFWSEVQPRFLRAYLPDATVVAAIDEKIRGKPDFDHMEILEGAHRDKLDELGRRVVDRMASAEDDILVFLDGDAFPVRVLMPHIVGTLRDVSLSAICRLENEEDYPHPSFCVTTVGFWKELGGTWQISLDPAAPTNELGGGRLRDLLRERGVQWRRLLRTNEFNPHPLLFGIYEGVIYHHGAGFRNPVTAADRKILREQLPELSGSQESFQHLCGIVADQNRAMSAMFKRLMMQSVDFYRILELPGK